MRLDYRFKMISCYLEILLSIPIISREIIISLDYIPVIITFIIHFITINLLNRNKEKIGGNLIGLLASLCSYVPFIGFTLHLISAMVLLFNKENSLPKETK